MKSLLLTAIVFSVCASVASAQPDQIIKQKAKATASHNNAQQGVPSAATPGLSTSAPRPAPVATKPNAHQQHIARLKADIAAIHHAGAATAEAKQQFATDLLGTAQGANKPSTNSVAALANSLLPALANNQVSTAADARLVEKLVVLMNSHGLSSTRTQEIAEEAQTALQSAGVPAADAAKISSDLQAIASEVQQASLQ
ncbi:MAG: hypothetical protein ACTHLW_13515 [Verrucomicrobiota bacterium]